MKRASYLLRQTMPDAATICALASAPGASGVAVFRLSGPQAAAALRTLGGKLPAPRRAALRDICHPQTRDKIDRAIALYFPAPHSFTGEDVVELHTHGGRAVINAVTHALAALPGLRLAEPGEFTRRAFENGKLDLTEAEAIADLVHAETEAQRKQALRQMDGALGKLYQSWHKILSHSLACMEAAIDFADEELPPDLAEKQNETLRALRADIAAHLNDNRRGERLRDGFEIAILGAPNAGKSSLLNALAQREAAIVSPVAGTTRDVIEVHLDIGGYPVTLADTAGLRDLSPEALAQGGHNAIENEGIHRALARAERADLKLLVIDAADPHPAPTHLIDADTLVVVNKADLGQRPATISPHALSLSALTGTGIDALLEKLTGEIARRFDTSPAPTLTRARHREALEKAAEHLDRAIDAAQTDLRAEDVRLAMRDLGRITGKVDVEDLLDIIFRDFCIGK